MNSCDKLMCMRLSPAIIRTFYSAIGINKSSILHSSKLTDSTFRFQLDVCTHPSTSRQQPAGPPRPRHGYPWGPRPPAWPRPSRRPTVPACPQPQRPQRGFGGLGWGRPHAAPGLRTRPPPTLHSAECGSSSGRQASKGKRMIGERTQPPSG